MLSRFYVVVAISSAFAQAWTSTSFSFATEIVCSTEYGSGSTQPTPLPRSTGTRTIIQSSTGSVVTVAVTSRITIATATSTLLTSTEVVAASETVTIPTSTIYSVIHSTIATAVYPKTICTNGVVPSTVTKYVGTYTPVSGQVTTLPSTYPTSITCIKRISNFLELHPIETTTVTSSVTVTTLVLAPTTTVTVEVDFGDTSTVYGTTVRTVITSYTVASSVAITSTACLATTTTTYAAKCAPTNLIGSINGVGLVSGTYAGNITVAYGPREDTPYNRDHSLCCQLCQNNYGCAGVMTGGSGACGLLYIGGPIGAPQCAKVFTYGTEEGVVAGAGLLVQSGCGTIEYVA